MLLRSLKRKILFHSNGIIRRCKHSQKIVVKPETSLVTDLININGDGFAPEAPITIKASVNCKSEGLSFMSFGHFVTSQNGSFDLSSSECLGGTYSGIDRMGLFWSMEKTGNSFIRFQMNDATTPLIYDFDVYEGHHDKMDWCIVPICKTSIRRSYLANKIKRETISDGIHGTLFTPSGQGPFPAIITLYGGTKRKQIVEDAAAIFANNGFVTLALAYFAVDGLPKIYADENIKIEYFEKAVDYLSSLKFVSSNAIGAYGQSMGGALCLAMSSFLPQIKAVTCVNGFITSLGCSTTYGNRKVNGLKYTIDYVDGIPNGTKQFIMENPETNPSCIYDFANSTADLLFINGLDDLIAAQHVDLAKKKMDEVGKENYEILKYPGMGHLIDAPFTPRCTVAGNPLAGKGTMIYYGGKDKRIHNMHVSEVWPKVISFFSRTLSNR